MGVCKVRGFAVCMAQGSVKVLVKSGVYGFRG